MSDEGWDDDEVITMTGRKIVQRPQTLDDLSELLGQVMAEQVAIRKIVKTAEKNSRRAPPIISPATLSIIVAVTSAIVTTIITVLKETGVLK